METAKVTPLFKKGDASDPSNYRPISVLTVLSTVVERYVHDSLYDFLQVNNLIYYLVRPGLFPIRNGRLLDLFRQSGFRKHHGSETALFKNES